MSVKSTAPFSVVIARAIPPAPGKRKRCAEPAAQSVPPLASNRARKGAGARPAGGHLRGGSCGPMNRGMTHRKSGFRLFLVYAAASALPIAVLGLGLGRAYKSELDRRALDQAATEAGAIANAGIEPALNGRDLTRPPTPSERAALAAVTSPLLQSTAVLRLRLRDRTGAVVFDAAHPSQGRVAHSDDDLAATAGTGRVVRRLTRLDSDLAVSRMPVGPRAVEAYIPIDSPGAARVIGVLDIDLPYEPIARSFATSNRMMLELIMLGLGVLWLALSAISWSVTKRLAGTVEREQAMRQLALDDQLTGLRNRRGFEVLGRQAFEVCERQQQPALVIYADVNGLKPVNDGQGHATGDQMLQEVGLVLASTFRDADVIARLGGDEFAVFLSNYVADPALAEQRLADAVEAHNRALHAAPFRLSLAVGTAQTDPRTPESLDRLLQRADTAMYKAKLQHRSRAPQPA